MSIPFAFFIHQQIIRGWLKIRNKLCQASSGVSNALAWLGRLIIKGQTKNCQSNFNQRAKLLSMVDKPILSQDKTFVYYCFPRINLTGNGHKKSSLKSEQIVQMKKRNLWLDAKYSVDEIV